MQHPAYKRTHERIQPHFDANELVGEIHRSLTTKQRLTTLFRVKQILLLQQQVNEASVRMLVEAGILPALLLQLGFCFQRHGTTLREVEQLCYIIHHVVRHCPEDVRHIVSKDIENQHFVELLARSLQQQDEATILRVLSILHTLSGSSNGVVEIMRCRQLLVRFTQVLAADNNSILLDNTSLTEALGALKNITYYAEEDRKTLLNLPGFLSVLTGIAFHHNTICEEKVQERLSSVFRNLVLSQDCRVILGQEPDFLNALVHMTSPSNSRIIRNILNVLHSLAMDKGSGLLLIFHGDGVVLNILKRLMVDKDDVVIRKRAARTVRLLANESSAPLLVHRVDLMELLSQRALQDENQAVRNEAAEAFAKCAGLVQAGQPHYQAVLGALVQLAKSPAASRDMLARALKEQAAYPENRIPMVRSVELVGILARIAASNDVSPNAKEDACCALLNLSLESANLKTLSNDCVLNALVENARGHPHNDASLRRQFALKTLVRLASDSTNREKMVNHDNLVKALIQFASTSPPSETKDNVKMTILSLVKEL